MDLTGYEEISLSFDYDFFAFLSAKGNNSSFFQVEVWDGTSWQTVLQESGTEN